MVRPIITTETEKRCSKCRVFKLKNCFYVASRNKTSGLQSWCKECINKRPRDKKPSGSYHKYDLKKNFGITVEEYEKILSNQKGVCAICLNTEKLVSHQSGRIWKLSVDHCHSTGGIRGLLCSQCNNGLGRFKDNPIFLQRAVEYIENYNKNGCLVGKVINK